MVTKGYGFPCCGQSQPPLFQGRKEEAEMANINVLSGLYNHYLTTYAPKKLRSNKADIDRDSELRKVYNSMIKLNKEAPLSIVNNSEEAVSFAVDMKENAREFKNTISSLSGIGEFQI